jgi:hypothetical protein
MFKRGVVAKPNPDSASHKVDVWNYPQLPVSFRHIVLIDTQSINPKQSSLSMGLKVTKGIFKVLSNQKSILIESNRIFGTFIALPIRERIVARLVSKCDVD